MSIDPSGGGTFDVFWTSSEGLAYNLVSSLDLSVPVGNWPVLENNSGIVAAVGNTSLTGVTSDDPESFFVVVEHVPRQN